MKGKKKTLHNFLLIMHEHLFVFRKPYKNEDTTKLKDSPALSVL